MKIFRPHARLVLATIAGLWFAVTSASASMIRDSEIEAGLEGLMAPLVEAAGFPEGGVRIRIIINPSYNAFVAGKRVIYVHSGLLTEASDAREFLGVMAHELGHVAEQHALRQIMRSAVIGIGIGLFLGNEDSVLEEIVGFGGSLVLMENSRGFELEADSLSAGWMAEIGRDPQALVRFFKRLSDECGNLCDGGGMLASHPSFRDRVRALSE